MKGNKPMTRSITRRIVTLGLAAVVVTAIGGTASGAGDGGATTCRAWHPPTEVSDRHHDTWNPTVAADASYGDAWNPIVPADGRHHRTWNPTVPTDSEHHDAWNPPAPADGQHRHAWAPTAIAPTAACRLP
jgi:hypothetical protein